MLEKLAGFTQYFAIHIGSVFGYESELYPQYINKVAIDEFFERIEELQDNDLFVRNDLNKFIRGFILRVISEGKPCLLEHCMGKIRSINVSSELLRSLHAILSDEQYPLAVAYYAANLTDYTEALFQLLTKHSYALKFLDYFIRDKDDKIKIKQDALLLLNCGDLDAFLQNGELSARMYPFFTVSVRDILLTQAIQTKGVYLMFRLFPQERRLEFLKDIVPLLHGNLSQELCNSLLSIDIFEALERLPGECNPTKLAFDILRLSSDSALKSNIHSAFLCSKLVRYNDFALPRLFMLQNRSQLHSIRYAMLPHLVEEWERRFENKEPLRKITVFYLSYWVRERSNCTPFIKDCNYTLRLALKCEKYNVLKGVVNDMGTDPWNGRQNTRNMLSAVQNLKQDKKGVALLKNWLNYKGGKILRCNERTLKMKEMLHNELHTYYPETIFNWSKASIITRYKNLKLFRDITYLSTRYSDILNASRETVTYISAIASLYECFASIVTESLAKIKAKYRKYSALRLLCKDLGEMMFWHLLENSISPVCSLTYAVITVLKSKAYLSQLSYKLSLESLPLKKELMIQSSLCNELLVLYSISIGHFDNEWTAVINSRYVYDIFDDFDGAVGFNNLINLQAKYYDIMVPEQKQGFAKAVAERLLLPGLQVHEALPLFHLFVMTSHKANDVYNNYILVVLNSSTGTLHMTNCTDERALEVVSSMNSENRDKFRNMMQNSQLLFKFFPPVAKSEGMNI